MKSGSGKKFISGYIEGYYGRLLDFEERAGLVRKLKDIGASHYLYAPKEDLLNRKEWRKPYPKGWLLEFRKFVAQSRRLGVSVIPGLAPGLSFQYGNEPDFRALVKKVGAFVAAGCDEFCLLMDDIPEQLPQSASGKFKSLGEAHGRLLQRLDRLKTSLGLRRIWFCPTVYSDIFAPGGLEKNQYLRDLALDFPPDMEWMWTGSAIVSEKITPVEFAVVSRMMGKGPILWDNLYANDYCPTRIFLGPLNGRPEGLKMAAAGLMLNPTGLYHTDLFHLDLLDGWQGGKSPRAVWAGALKKAGVPREFGDVSEFLSTPFARPVEKLKPSRIHELRCALHPLIWDWKSPLQREWYPYLYALDCELRLLLPGKRAPDAIWVRKKFSSIIAKFLIKDSRQ